MESNYPNYGEGVYFNQNGMALPPLEPPATASATTASTTTASATTAREIGEGVYFNQNGMVLRPLEPPATASATTAREIPVKKMRKPYTITKSREIWTEAEHSKFEEAVSLYKRNWKRIQEYIGSKTVIQIRSHAQKHFIKMKMNGKEELVPPPRPKRKASHPYPQKASECGKSKLA
ncbi:hypothetical protein SAY87_030536 [Trapa incisa]|uniref:Uncharacterized protein n=1 Tax=Trapa incisa TaxID=236973 RepID=A0AAN7KPJ4_9MYRT|nr:hypothetical protein SAY87_030536 [Trapa incisa]